MARSRHRGGDDTLARLAATGSPFGPLMSTASFLLVIGSAFAHATWNVLLKRSNHKTTFLWSFMTVSFVAFLLPAAVVVGLEGLTMRGALYGLVSAALHGCYGLALSRSYELGDLSSAYPVARGMGVTLIPLAGVFILGEDVSAAAAVGIALVVAGIYVVQSDIESVGDLLRPLRNALRPANRVALLTGGLIASYSLWDKQALDHIEPLVLNQFNLIGYLILMAPLAVYHQGSRLRQEWGAHGRGIVVAGLLAPFAYVLVLVALTTSPVSYVGPTREVGIVLGTMYGVFFLREGFGRSRVGGSLLIVAGALTLGLAP